ncbi:N-acetylmuramic acid 6-phosphate etherase [Bowdeniella nasicola]|uniref:N-acetylmuramic acid 6-phosphate etherase n=1 Tax=Bowdeniella nasicola TaxID=208480 RepID=A0A1H4ACK1_9ACTO|nr:N-acetylmuramic acid 6-phosphate etherase [Bowdeniella nasicola]
MDSQAVRPEDLARFTTEMADPRYADIDLLETTEMVRVMNEADAEVSRAVKRASASIVEAIDAISAQLARGGRLIYVGAGTAGRMGVLDASECPPTFSTDPSLVVGIIAGGPGALTTAVEGAEDDYEAGLASLESLHLTSLDTVVGISASGRTPFVRGAIAAARATGAVTAAISSNPNAALSAAVDYPIEVIVGPEVISGSTRLKAGSAQKQVLNMISTLSMVKLGKTYGNLMVDVNATNQKLEVRAQLLVTRITGASADEAQAALRAAGGSVKTAIVMIARGVPAAEAEEILSSHGGSLRAAIGKLPERAS